MDSDRNDSRQLPKEDPFDVDKEFTQTALHSAAVTEPDRRAAADTEFAADTASPGMDLTPNGRRFISHRNTTAQKDNADARIRQGTMLGWISLILGIGSLFFWQAVLGPAAILTGIFAWVRGSRALGSWAIVLGFVALLAYFILVPRYA